MTFQLPDHFEEKALGAGRMPIAVHSYRTKEEVVKSKVILRSYLISFLLEGSKYLHHLQDQASITPASFLLLKPTHCLMTERFAGGHQYRSLLCFFESTLLSDIASKHQLTNPDLQQTPEFLVLPIDDFIKSYVESLQALHEQGLIKNSAIWQLKLEELLLYLVDRHGDSVLSFLLSSQTTDIDAEFQRIIEDNIDHKLSLEELAFLCKMSLSTFKRKFREKYEYPPARWFQKQRLQKAKRLLIHYRQSPSEVYQEAGFENFSSFSKAFKREFGKSPKAFKSGKQ